MKNKGIVKKINESKITIEIYKDLNCSSCSSCNKKSHGTQTFFYDKNDLSLGDIVIFSIEDKNLLKISFLLYILPVFFMIFVYIFTSFFNTPEKLKILLSFSSIVIFYFIIYLLEKKEYLNFLNTIKIEKEIL